MTPASSLLEDLVSRHHQVLMFPTKEGSISGFLPDASPGRGELAHRITLAFAAGRPQPTGTHGLDTVVITAP